MAQADRERVHVSGTCGGRGDDFCLLSAARHYARRFPRAAVTVSTVLPEVAAAYADDLISVGEAGRRVFADCTDRHRVKDASPDFNYLGTYLAALGLPVEAPPALDLPELPPPDLPPKSYVALQPYAGYARGPADRRAFVQALVGACREARPGWPVIAVGRDTTRRDLKWVDYRGLGTPLDLLRWVQHAALVLTPRSASAHAASAYGVPTFLWLPDDGENWHLDYPDWPRCRTMIEDGAAAAAARFRWFARDVRCGAISRRPGVSDG